MPEFGPGNRWVVIRDIKADPGGCMAIVENEAYIAPCRAKNPDVPIYTKREIAMIKAIPHSAEIFRSIQKIKRVFPTARVVSSE